VGLPDCTGLTPASIKCELLTNFRVKMTLPVDTKKITGTIGGMENPFSLGKKVYLKIKTIQYRSPAG
jgi:hypothetical protein